MVKLKKTEEDVLEWIDTAEHASHQNLWRRTGHNSSFEAVYRTMNTLVKKGLVEKDGDKFKLTLDGQSALAVIRKEEIKRFNEREKKRKQEREANAARREE